MRQGVRKKWRLTGVKRHFEVFERNGQVSGKKMTLLKLMWMSPGLLDDEDAFAMIAHYVI